MLAGNPSSKSGKTLQAGKIVVVAADFQLQRPGLVGSFQALARYAAGQR